MKPVVFVGMGAGKYEAPFDKSTYEIWTCNMGCLLFKDRHIDKCFDMHDWVSSDYYPKFYEELQKKQKYKVVRPYRDKTVPNCEVFPKQEADWMFNHHAYGSTMSYIVVYAALEGKRDLFIYGMDTQEFVQYPEMGVSFGYCRGIAEEYGLRVHIISPDVPSKPHVYGYRAYSYKDSYNDMLAVFGNEDYVIKDGADEDLKKAHK